MSYWSDIARNWKLIGPPLRPSEDDPAPIKKLIRRRAPAQRLNALVFGATSEYADLPWSAHATVTAVDRCEEMIRARWPLQGAVIADWRNLPFQAGSHDMALMDGGLHLLPTSEQQRSFIAEAARVILPGGVLVVRLFVPAARHATTDELVNDLAQRRIVTVDELKIRLWMLARGDGGVVRLHDVWECANRITSIPNSWQTALEAYRGRDESYCLLAQSELDTLLLGSGTFELVGRRVPPYPMGAGCPTVILRRRVPRGSRMSSPPRSSLPE